MTHEVTVVSRFIELVNAGDAAAASELLSEDHFFVDALGHAVHGRERMRQAWTAYFSWFPDYRIEVRGLLASGAVVAVFGTASGTYAGSEDTEAGRWSIPAAWRAVVRDGKIREWQVYADNKPVHTILEAESPG